MSLKDDPNPFSMDDLEAYPGLKLVIPTPAP